MNGAVTRLTDNIVRIETSRGDLYVGSDRYDALTDEEFAKLVGAYEAEDYQAVRELMAVAETRVPGLVKLAAANSRQERDRAVEHAVRALAGDGGDYASVESHGSAIIAMAEVLGGYIRNGS